MRQSWGSPNHSAWCTQEPPIYWPRGLTSDTCPLLHKSIKAAEYAPENTLSVSSSFPFSLIQATAPTPKNQMQVSISWTTGGIFSLDLSSLTSSLCFAPGRDFTHHAKHLCSGGGPRPAWQGGIHTRPSDSKCWSGCCSSQSRGLQG